MKSFALLLLAAGLVVVSSTSASAQTDFSGVWVMDRDISGDLTKATFEPAQMPARRNVGGFSGGGFGGRGFGGGRRVGGNTGNGDSRGSTPLTAEEKARLKALADYVRTFGSITIEHTDHSTFTVTDAQGRSQLFPTDGTKTPLAIGSDTIDTVTKWDGPHLVTTFTVSASRELIFTYVLVPATRQMALRVNLDESGRLRGDVPELRLVYKRKSS